MSIQNQLNELERKNINTQIKHIPVIEYFQSAKVSGLMHKIVSNLKESGPRLSESNQNFKLYLYHNKLEMFRYITHIHETPKFHVPGPGERTKEIKTVDIESESSFVLRFDESLTLTITKFAASLSTDELIENLEELLFSN